MATQQEINDLQELVRNAKLTADELRAVFRDLGGAAQDAQRNVGSFSEELGRGTRLITSSMSSFAASVGKGNTSITSLSGITKSLADGLGGVLASIPKLGIIGKGIGKAVETMGDVATYATDIMDSGLNSFQELSRVGLVGSESIADLSRDIHNARMPLQTFTGLVGANSKQLAALQGTAGDASSAFATTMGDMRKNMNMELRKIGFTIDEIGETVINFADLQRRLGRGQRIDSKFLQEQTQEYAKELDKVAKLTGLQRAEQQKIVDAAMREGRWRATIEDLGTKQQTQMNMLNNSMSAFSSEMSEGLRDQASGFTQSNAAQKLFRTTNGASVEIMEKVKSGQLSAQEAMLAFQEAVKANRAPMKALNQAVGDSAGVYVRYHQSMDLMTADFNNLSEAVNKQTKQIGTQADPTTAALVSIQDSLQQISGDITATFMDSPNIAKIFDAGVDKFAVGTDKFYDLFKGDAGERLFTLFKNDGPKRIASQTEVEMRNLEAERRSLLLKKAELEAPPSYIAGKGVTIFEPNTDEEKLELESIDKQIDELDNQLSKLNEVFKEETAKRTDSVSAILTQMGVERNERESIFKPLTPLEGSINTLLDADHPVLSDTISKEGGTQIKTLLEQAKAGGVDIAKDSKLWQDIYEIIRNSSESTGMFGSGRVNVEFPDELKVIPGQTPLDVNVIPKSSHITPEAPKEMAKGGVLSGPKSGYNVTMHGTEAVVPLPDKKGIPVNVQAEAQSTKHIELLEKQVSKLTDVVSAIQDNTNVNSKILRVSQN